MIIISSSLTSSSSSLSQPRDLHPHHHDQGTTVGKFQGQSIHHLHWSRPAPQLSMKPITSLIFKFPHRICLPLVALLADQVLWALSAIIALCNKSNGSYDIKDFGTLSLIFSTSKYFRRKCQPCPSFFSHPNISDKWKRVQLSLDQMKKKERVKVKS